MNDTGFDIYVQEVGRDNVCPFSIDWKKKFQNASSEEELSIDDEDHQTKEDEGDNDQSYQQNLGMWKQEDDVGDNEVNIQMVHNDYGDGKQLKYDEVGGSNSMNNEEKYEDVRSKIVTYINGAQTNEVLVQDLVSHDTNVVVDCNMRGPNMENDNSYANVNRCDGRAQIDGISYDVSGL